ncbi:MAG: HIT domain-containing protein [Deltaproteobacteria bacterium]
MERIWAPWRMEYIERCDEQKGCIFCELPKKESDRENLILFRGQDSFVIMNKFPYAAGHLMVAPYRHTADLNDFSDKELTDISINVRRCINVLKKAMNPQGFNVGANLGHAAGAGIIDHVHYHIVPRWNGDSNFMPVIGDIRVVSEGLEKTYDKLNPVFYEK